MSEINLKNSIVLIEDATAVTPKSVEIFVDEGTLNFEESKSYMIKKNKGKIIGKIEEDEIPMTVSFDLSFLDMVGRSGAFTVRELMYGELDDGTTPFTSTDDAGWKHATDITVKPDALLSNTYDEDILLKKFRPTSVNFDAAGSKISVTGECGVSKAIFTKVVA